MRRTMLLVSVSVCSIWSTDREISRDTTQESLILIAYNEPRRLELYSSESDVSSGADKLRNVNANPQ